MRWFMEVIYDFFTSFAGVCYRCRRQCGGEDTAAVFRSADRWTAGTLTVSAVFGYYGGKRALPQKCSELLRGIGLMLFFVGTGVPAGAQAIAAFSPVWVIYGAIITVVPVVAVGIIYRVSKAVVIS